MEFAASFSGGKDSTLAIKRMLDKGHRLVAIIVSTKEDKTNSWTHNLAKEYFKQAADIFRCEVIFTDTGVDDYEENFEKALIKSKNYGAVLCIFGDIDIERHLKWNNDRCKNAGIECIHPLFMENREDIAEEFIESGIKAEIIKVDENLVSEKNIGRVFDREFIDDIKNTGIDICGENGEFHTKINLDSLKDALRDNIYVDNASTCFPKAPVVGKVMSDFINNESFSINRGTYMKAYELTSKVIDVREKILKLFNAPKGYQCIFAPSATELVNLILRGYLNEGDEIIVDDRMHNSVWRTLEYLDKNDITIKVWSCSDNKNKKKFDTPEKNIRINEEIYYNSESEFKKYNYRIDDLKVLISEKTKAVFLTAVDNVTGFFHKDIEEIGRLCSLNKIMFFIDGVQSVCERKIDISSILSDAIIMTAHIGLMGPEGIAFMIVKDSCAKKLRPLIYGGTGSQSNSPCMPEILPDKLEAGTLNLPGIISVGSAIDYVNEIGIDNIICKKHELGKYLRKEMSDICGVSVKGFGSFCCVSADNMDDSIVSFNLDMINHIMTRVGIQCSPSTHIAEGSFPSGCIRMSVGYFNNKYDIDYIVKSVRENI